LSEVVSLRVDDGIAIITIDNPPVNALSAAVRESLLAFIETADGDPAVNGVLLVGAGRGFIAGADIREFGKPPRPPGLGEVCNRIEACSKPVLASLHGATLGGGLEVALAAHYRVTQPQAQLGLPEVRLGLMPGAGGTQRTPRILGCQRALALMLSGQPLSGTEAADMGLVDALAGDPDPTAAGIARLRELLASGAGPRPTRERRDGLGSEAERDAAVAAARADLQRSAGALFSPHRIVDAVACIEQLPFDDALARERELFRECMASPQREGLIHAFFAERECTKVPGLDGVTPREVSRIGIVGGGTMGSGIAVAVLEAGLDVVMLERDADSLARGRANVEAVYERMVQRKRLDGPARDARLARLRTSLDYADLADCDLVIEAAFEDMAVKQQVFGALDAACRPGAVLASNTSYLDIDALAAGTRRPGDVLGLHFFSPANIMRLLEVVVAEQTAPEVVATGFALARRLGKIPVRAGVCDGFIGNRILAVYRQAADHMLEDGASPYEIDAAVRDFGYPMGPFQVSDLAGGDIGWATRKRKAATRDPRDRYVEIADRICERGWFGQKTGRGWYRYPDGPRHPQPDPEVEAIVAAERDRAGVTPRAFSREEIQRRYLAAMINEGANVVAEGIALRPLDVDVTLLHGYGFPRHHGGPMHYADRLGLKRVLSDIETFARENPRFWIPSPLLRELAARDGRFAERNTRP
jgi:3-hydroxyacyl-CoA dehydrogenase